MPEFPPAIAQYFDCINNERWDAFPEVWAADAELVGVGGHHYRGRENVLGYYPPVLAPFPVHFDDAYTCYADGDVYTVEIEFRGETHEGTPVSFEAVDVFTLRDGKIGRLTTWYDVDAVRDAARRPGPRETRIRRVIERAASRSPFYQGRGLDPDAELSSLPTTTEADVLGDPAAFATTAGPAVARLTWLDGQGALPLTHGDAYDEVRMLRLALETAGAKRGEIVASLGIPGFEAAVAATGATLLSGGGSGTVEVSILAPAETGPLGVECAQGQLHLLADDHVLEVIDGRLVTTPLCRRGAPLLRYATSESGSLVDGQCACGSPLPRFARA